MAKIKTQDELHNHAPWFDIQHYAECDSLTPLEWADVLLRKRKVRYICDLVDEDLSGELIIPANEVENFLDAGVPRGEATTGQELPSRFMKNASFTDSALGIDPEGIVKPIRLADLELQDFTDQGNAHQLVYDEVNYSGFAHLSIDLSARDTDLIRSFQSALKLYRQRFGIPNPSKRGTWKNVRKLKDYNVLGYLDITHWATLTGNSVSANTIAWVLSEGLQGERHITDTVKPLAEAALTTGFIANLRTLE